MTSNIAINSFKYIETKSQDFITYNKNINQPTIDNSSKTKTQILNNINSKALNNNKPSVIQKNNNQLNSDNIHYTILRLIIALKQNFLLNNNQINQIDNNQYLKKIQFIEFFIKILKNLELLQKHKDTIIKKNLLKQNLKDIFKLIDLYQIDYNIKINELKITYNNFLLSKNFTQIIQHHQSLLTQYAEQINDEYNKNQQIIINNINSTLQKIIFYIEKINPEQPNSILSILSLLNNFIEKTLYKNNNTKEQLIILLNELNNILKITKLNHIRNNNISIFQKHQLLNLIEKNIETIHYKISQIKILTNQNIKPNKENTKKTSSHQYLLQNIQNSLSKVVNILQKKINTQKQQINKAKEIVNKKIIFNLKKRFLKFLLIGYTFFLTLNSSSIYLKFKIYKNILILFSIIIGYFCEKFINQYIENNNQSTEINSDLFILYCKNIHFPDAKNLLNSFLYSMCFAIGLIIEFSVLLILNKNDIIFNKDYLWYLTICTMIVSYCFAKNISKYMQDKKEDSYLSIKTNFILETCKSIYQPILAKFL